MADPNTVKFMLIGERHPGCHAELFDNGERMQLPVCMGGIAIVGCNNYEDCRSKYGERIDARYEVHMVNQDDEGRVSSVTSIPRAPLVAGD